MSYAVFPSFSKLRGTDWCEFISWQRAQEVNEGWNESRRQTERHEAGPLSGVDPQIAKSREGALFQRGYEIIGSIGTFRL